MDLVSRLPLSDGYIILLAVLNRFSKIIHILPYFEDIDALNLANSFFFGVVKVYGLHK